MAALAFDARHRVCFPASASFAMLDLTLSAARRGWRELRGEGTPAAI
jgi:hypothetical protein